MKYSVGVLINGINSFLDGDYDRPLGNRFRKDGSPSKHDTCKHGVAMWETCEACVEEHFRHVLVTAEEK